MNTFTTVQRCLALLSKRDRRLIYAITAGQSALALLDLVAVVMIGLVAVLAAQGATGEYPPIVSDLLAGSGREHISPLAVALGLAVAAGLLMIVKSIVSFLVTRRIFRFLASRQALLSISLARRFFSSSLDTIQGTSSQQLAYALTIGSNAATLGVVGQSTIVVSELALLGVLTIALMLIDPVVTIFTVTFFAIVGIALHRVVSTLASTIGQHSSETHIASTAAVQELIRTYRQIAVSGRLPLLLDELQVLRTRAGEVQSNLQVVTQVPKFVYDVAMILGAALLAGSQLLTRDLPAAVAVIALFLAAASRVMPSLMRLQGALLAIRSSLGMAQPTLLLAESTQVTAARTTTPASGFAQLASARVSERMLAQDEYPVALKEGAIALSHVSVRYPGQDEPALRDLTLYVASGSSLAIVGPTGAGKSTLADVLLGLLAPESGTVRIAGVTPLEAICLWPGSLAYVPQDSAVVDGTIRSNVALALPPSWVSDDRVWESLERAHLAEFVKGTRDELSTIVGENGVRLSGGQRQRLGLARALYSRPKILVLDEATSALDAETEQSISTALDSLSGSVTLVVIAHRLATIRRVDQVAYLSSGQLARLGTFEEVRDSVPAFDRQATILGL